MADQNENWKTGSTPGAKQPGLSQGGQSTTSQSTYSPSGMGSSAGSTSSAAGSSGGMDAGYSGGDMSGNASTTDSIKQGSARLASEARQYAGDMALRAKEKGRTMFAEQKDYACEQVSSVAQAFRSTADQLQGGGQAQASRYISMVADQMEAFGSRLRDKDLDTLIEDTQNLARRSPGAFFAGTVVAGFLLSRFLKSSSKRRYASLSDYERELEFERETEESFISGRGPVSGAGAPGTGSTPGTALGTSGVGTTPSSVSGSNSGGNP